MTRNLRLLWVGAVAALTLACQWLPGGKDDPGDVVKKFVEALNNDDAAAIMPIVADNVILISEPGCDATRPCQGKGAIQGMFVRRRGVTSTITSKNVVGDTVKARLETKGGAVTAAGVERVVTFCTLTIAAGKIAKVVFERDATDQQTSAFSAWIQSKRVGGGAGEGQGQEKAVGPGQFKGKGKRRPNQAP